MQRKGAFDYILLETTGLADPGSNLCNSSLQWSTHLPTGPIASLFWRNEEFSSGLGKEIILDGVICVVDAFFGKQQMEEDHSDDSENVGESLRYVAST